MARERERESAVGQLYLSVLVILSSSGPGYFNFVSYTFLVRTNGR